MAVDIPGRGYRLYVPFDVNAVCMLTYIDVLSQKPDPINQILSA